MVYSSMVMLASIKCDALWDCQQKCMFMQWTKIYSYYRTYISHLDIDIMAKCKYSTLIIKKRVISDTVWVHSRLVLQS